MLLGAVEERHSHPDLEVPRSIVRPVPAPSLLVHGSIVRSSVKSSSLDVRVLKGGGARAERLPEPDTDLLAVLALWLADVSAEALIAARSSPTDQDGFDGSSEADR